MSLFPPWEIQSAEAALYGELSYAHTSLAAAELELSTAEAAGDFAAQAAALSS